MKQLYDLHAGPVYRFLLGLTFGRRQAAEDLLQETLLRAWRQLDNLDSDISTLRPWLLTVARRVAIDAGRAQKARPTVVGDVDLSGLPAPDNPVDRLIVAQTLRTSMAALSPEHRRVIFELYYMGRTAPEVAALLGIPEGTVRSRAFHALRSLRASLTASESPE